MASFLGISISRFTNIENCIAKMNEDDFRQIMAVMPEAFEYILMGNPMRASALLESDTLMITIPSRIKAGLAPPDFLPEHFIDDTKASQVQAQD